MRKFLRIRRSSKTGRFVTAADAASDPAGTTTETVPTHTVAVAAADLLTVLRTTGDANQLTPASLTAMSALADALE